MVDVPHGPVTPSRPFRIPAPPAVDLGLDDVAAAAGGDERAFSVLFRQLDPPLRRYATALVGQDADDVVADAWLQIARDLHGFRGDLDGLRGWCARIVRNRAIDWVRREGRRPSSATPADQLDRAAPDDTATDALDNVSTRRAVELIASLPREQAEAVLLRVVVGVDTARAADILGKSPGAVRVAAHRGLRRLARMLETAATDDQGGAA